MFTSDNSSIRVDDPELATKRTCVRPKKESLHGSMTSAKSRRKDGSVKMESASSARQGKHVVCPAMSVERKWEAVNILQESRL
mmetsp:Transcript_517/g.516  ORF Transcript_517/g.516 Transcript_517/m.516 type:complete len:83 (+) Transcript_517:89-337(+)